MLTFETLFELLRKEKFNQELQELDETFYNDILQYLEEKTAVLSTEQKTDSIFAADAKKTQLQLENAKKIIKELYEKREGKILNLALLSSRANIKESSATMLKQERLLYNEFLETLDNHRTGILNNILTGKKVTLKQKKSSPKDIKTDHSQSTQSKLKRYLYAVPKFVADDLNVYGPFEQEEMAHLPIKTANLLIKRKRAEEIKIENSQN